MPENPPASVVIMPMPRVRSFGDGLYDIATRARDPEFHAGLVASALAKVENLRPAPVLTSFPLRAPPAPQVELIAIELFDWLQNVQAQIELRLIFRWSCAVVALGQRGQRIGSGFVLLTPSGGLRLVTAHHVLLDCGWDAVSRPLIEIGVGTTITHDSWTHRAQALAHSPSPRPPAPHAADHRLGYLARLDLALLDLAPLDGPLPYLESGDDVMVGERVAILGFGMQTASQTAWPVQSTMIGSVACTERVDQRFGCRVLDIQGDMLHGHSGGPVISLRTRKVVAVALGSHSERLDIFSVGPNGSMPATDHQGHPMGVNNPVGGLHVAMPIAKLDLLEAPRSVSGGGGPAAPASVRRSSTSPPLPRRSRSE